MAMRSAMRRSLALDRQGGLRRQQQRHGEHRALARARRCARVMSPPMRRASWRAIASPSPAPCVTPSPLPRLCRSKSFSALSGAKPRPWSLMSRRQWPSRDAGRELHAAAAVLVRIVEQVLEDHAQAVAIGQHLHRVDDRRAARRRRCEVRARCASRSAMKRAASMRLHALARLARHGALIGEDGLGEMLEPIALELAELDELGALRIRECCPMARLCSSPFTPATGVLNSWLVNCSSFSMSSRCCLRRCASRNSTTRLPDSSSASSVDSPTSITLRRSWCAAMSSSRSVALLRR